MSLLSLHVLFNLNFFTYNAFLSLGNHSYLNVRFDMFWHFSDASLIILNNQSQVK